jgi:imidazolonepropionase-like amidohydrolase
MQKNLITILFVLGVLLTGTAQESGSVLIKNATLITITDGVKEDTDLLIKDGKISSMGAGLSVGSEVKVIDAEGMYVMPGIIDAHSHIAIDAVNEATDPVTAQVWVGDALNPFDVNIYRALAGGVTISHAMHGSANAIGGQCETIKHRWGVTDPEDMRMKDAPRTIKFALGENPMRVHGEGQSIVPATRMGMEQVFRNSFEEGKAYAAAWKNFASGKSKTPPQYSLQKQTMADIIAGDIIIHCHSYRADEILMLMDVLEDYGVNKICFQHVNEGFKVAPELAAFGAHASVFSDWWAYKFEVYYSTAYNAAILAKNGVVTSINSDSRELIRHLYHEAAKSQKYGGLSDEDALKLITINPAIQLGIDDRVGSLEKGKDGDVVVFSKHPLSIYAVPQYTIVDGVVRFDVNEDPSDMRLDIDPEEAIPTFMEKTEHNHDDSCLQDVQGHFSHKH